MQILCPLKTVLLRKEILQQIFRIYLCVDEIKQFKLSFPVGKNPLWTQLAGICGNSSVGLSN